MKCETVFVNVADLAAIEVVDGPPDARHLPELLTVEEAAGLLRKTVKATYAAIERGQVPGVVRKPGLALLIRRDELRAHVGLT